MAVRYAARRLRAHYIAAWLSYFGLSQQELADRMGTDKANVSRWINDPKRVNLDVLSGVADALGLGDVGDLLRSPAQAMAARNLRETLRAVLEPEAEDAPPSPRQRAPASRRPLMR